MLIIALVAAYFQFVQPQEISQDSVGRAVGEVAADNSGDQSIAVAFEQHRHNVQVEGQGTVTKVLEDDVSGVRHQRFVVQLANGQTLLVAHNIDLAPRVDGLNAGDRISFYGEYEWNPKGGVIHWTHHDPAGRHLAGWIKHNGNTYQ